MDTFVFWFNAVFLVGFGIVAIAMLIATRAPDSGARAAHSYSVRARLPFGSDAVAVSVRGRLRALKRANMWGLLIILVVLGFILSTTPLGANSLFLWLVAVSTLCMLAIVNAVVTVRERLFAPSPTAVRIARPSRMQVADYLGPWRRHAPTVLLPLAILAAGAVAAAQTSGRVGSAIALTVYVSLAVAVAAALFTRIAEQRIITQPQPASNTLELAWDDSFRSDSLGYLRLGAALAAWVPIGLAVAMLSSALLTLRSPELSTLLEMFPFWGVAILQVLYTWRQGRMPASLYPDFLRVPRQVAQEAPA